MAAQIDKDKSLGGFVSSSPIPNDLIGNLFGEISAYTIENNFRETKALVIKNEGSAATGLTTWFENLATHPFVNIEIAAVALTENVLCTPHQFSMEKITSMRGTPIGATFYTANSIGTAVSLGNLAAGAMLGIWLRMTLKPNIQSTYYSAAALAAAPLTEQEDPIVWHFDWT
jgi:hypothetical protein